MASGPFSSALAAAKASLDSLLAVPHLPASASPIAKSIDSAMTPFLAKGTEVQKAVLAYCTSALPELQTILSQLKSGAEPSSVSAKLTDIAKRFAQLQGQTKPLNDDASKARAAITAAASQVATLENTLNDKIADLKGKIGAAKSKEKAAKDKYYYLIALGPFGLVGLAAALALYEKWSGEVDDLEKSIKSLRAQIVPIKAMVAACHQLGDAGTAMLTAIGNLDNTIDEVGSDCHEIVANLGESKEIELFVAATTAAIQTLKRDAS